MAIMEQKEHIATLCAAGTVGIAAAGFALGIEEVNACHITPGKRKWPGASSAKPPGAIHTPFVGRRSVSQPVPVLNNPQEESPATFTSSLFRKRTLHDLRPSTAHFSDTTADSRASSLNRSGKIRPRTADTRSTSERRDTSTGSSWLKRISTVSSSYGSSPAGSIWHHDGTVKQPLSNPSQFLHNGFPNKLVKRSTSQRALSNDQASGTFLRRPATSHQRTATLQEWNSGRIVSTASRTPNTQPDGLAMESDSPPTWRPFFERGYPRKRHSTGGTRDVPPVRTVSTPQRGRPILVLGRSVEASEPPGDFVQESAPTPVVTHSEPSSRQRLRRSLSSMHRASRRRFVTDPVVKVNNEAVNGTMSSIANQSPLSPLSNVSAFDVELPNGSPAFTSSPTMMPIKNRFSFRKRESNALSDPTTVSSDNDTRVFTDDDSMDFQSDSAFDSLTTRATVSSHSAMQPPKLETIFNDEYQAQDQTALLEDLMERTSLNNSRFLSTGRDAGSHRNHGIGISGLNEDNMEIDTSPDTAVSRTPVKATSVHVEDLMATPVAIKPILVSDVAQQASDSANGFNHARQTDRMPQTESNAEEDIDWSPLSDVSEKILNRGGPSDTGHALSLMCSSPVLPQCNQEVTFDDLIQEDKRTSIFDWSEQQRANGDLTHGFETRPKTVHGKQTHDNSRSRSSGRKGPSQLHLRSQSVPTNRDANAESTPLSVAKFSTWGLGHKPVSEEWSDDFEFDDLEEEPQEMPQLAITTTDTGNRGSMRGVKVPQSIIDRQASVHIQFGQVQEFMLLVEELKRLRARGSTLNLLESHSKQLWDDAESIINLATINDEEDDLDDNEPQSPSAFDVFGDEISLASRNGVSPAVLEDSRRHSATQRSFSSPATPPSGRPRGESLAQAKTFLQTIHQSRNNNELSLLPDDNQPLKKLPFDTQDLKDLVVKSSVITRALKEIIRKAEGVSISPTKTPPRTRDPAFSQIFDAPDVSPCPPFRHPELSHSRNANAYLNTTLETNDNTREIRLPFTTFAAMV